MAKDSHPVRFSGALVVVMIESECSQPGSGARRQAQSTIRVEESTNPEAACASRAKSVAVKLT